MMSEHDESSNFLQKVSLVSTCPCFESQLLPPSSNGAVGLSGGTVGHDQLPILETTMKALLAMVTGLLALVGCGNGETPTQKAQKSANAVKKLTSGKVAPVVKDVGAMTLSQQDW